MIRSTVWILVGLLIVVEVVLVLFAKLQTWEVWEISTEVSSYQLLTTAEVQKASPLLFVLLFEDVMLTTTEVPDHYFTRQKMTANQYLHSSQVSGSSDGTLLMAPTATPDPNASQIPPTPFIPVYIPATFDMTFNGRLTPGAVVALWSVPVDNVTTVTTLIAERVLVLNVQPLMRGSNEQQQVNAFSHILTLAVPQELEATISTAIANKSLALTLAE